MKKMNFFRYCTMLAVALFAGATMMSCDDKDEPTPPNNNENDKPVYEDPTVKVTAGEATFESITFTVESTNAGELAYTVAKKGGVAPTPADVLTKGTKIEALDTQSVTVGELSANTTYRIYAVATNEGGKQVMAEVVEMATEEKKPEPVAPTGDNFIQFGDGAKEGISYAGFDTNGGANVRFYLTSSNMVEKFMDLFYSETCRYYLSINPQASMVWETGGEVNLAAGNYGYVLVNENIGTGGSYNSWMAPSLTDNSQLSGVFSVKIIDKEANEFEISIDAVLPPTNMNPNEPPMRVKAYYKGVFNDGDNEEQPNDPGTPTEEMVPLPEGNAFTVGEMTKEIKSVVWEGDPANDYMSWNVYFCTAEGITSIAEAEKVEHVFGYLDVTSATWGAPMYFPGHSVWFYYQNAEGVREVEWLTSDVDYSGEANGGIWENGSMGFTCQTTLSGGLAINYSGSTVWDDRYWDDGMGGTEVIQ